MLLRFRQSQQQRKKVISKSRLEEASDVNQALEYNLLITVRKLSNAARQ
uniref:Uncharacterized protein n=1 Tax=Rhizophora mucronata TaxID=61149 RepID=A0A2P2P758_RHIMU